MAQALTAEQFNKKQAFEKRLKDQGFKMPTIDGWRTRYNPEADAVEYRHISEGMSREPVPFVYLMSSISAGHYQGAIGAATLAAILAAKRNDAVKRWDARMGATRWDLAH